MKKSIGVHAKDLNMSYGDGGNANKASIVDLSFLFSKKTAINEKFGNFSLNIPFLEINSGDRVAIFGANGAGKSTLLKVLAGIYPISSGELNIMGSVCPLFEFATGFEMNQSGLQNIYIRLLLLGLSKREAEDLVPGIVEFSELGHYIHNPVKTYSAGMSMRLAFSATTAIKPEILLLDELIGTGDASFSAKASKRMRDFISLGKILIFTSHSQSLAKEFCSKGIVLKKGVLIYSGELNDAYSYYIESCKL